MSIFQNKNQKDAIALFLKNFVPWAEVSDRSAACSCHFLTFLRVFFWNIFPGMFYWNTWRELLTFQGEYELRNDGKYFFLSVRQQVVHAHESDGAVRLLVFTDSVTENRQVIVVIHLTEIIHLKRKIALVFKCAQSKDLRILCGFKVFIMYGRNVFELSRCKFPLEKRPFHFHVQTRTLLGSCQVRLWQKDNISSLLCHHPPERPTEVYSWRHRNSCIFVFQTMLLPSTWACGLCRWNLPGWEGRCGRTLSWTPTATDSSSWKFPPWADRPANRKSVQRRT